MTETNQTTQAPADDFELEVAVRILKNGKAWTRQLTESTSMDQTNAVIAQHVVVEAVKGVLFKMGAASAAAKDPDFAAKYAQIKALVG